MEYNFLFLAFINTYEHFAEPMEAKEFKDFAKAMTDYIAEYLENIRDR